MKKRKTSENSLNNQRRGIRIAPISNPDLTGHPELEFARDSASARLTITACCLLVAFAFIWASLVSVEEKVSGTGMIETSGQIERIEHPYGGLVRSLSVRANDILPAGAVLLQFDTDHIEREMRALDAQIATLENEGQRVRFLMQANGSEVPVGDGRGDAASQAFWSEQSYLIAQLETIEAEDERLAAQLEGAQARALLVASELEIVEDQLVRYSKFVDTGTVRLIDRERLQRESLKLSRELAEIGAIQVEIGTARHENGMKRAELLAQRRRDAAVRRTKIEEELITLRQALANAEARIERSEVRTATGGKVHRIEVLNANEVIAPGDVIAEIVPPGNSFRAVVNISADRIGSIRTGMDVRLKIVSYDFTRFGSISARVSDVSPTSFMNNAGELVYQVVVELPDNLPTGERPVAVRPGMTVIADVLTGERSIMSYLLRPVRRIQDQSLSEA